MSYMHSIEFYLFIYLFIYFYSIESIEYQICGCLNMIEAESSAGNLLT